MQLESEDSESRVGSFEGVAGVIPLLIALREEATEIDLLCDADCESGVGSSAGVAGVIPLLMALRVEAAEIDMLCDAERCI